MWPILSPFGRRSGALNAIAGDQMVWFGHDVGHRTLPGLMNRINAVTADRFPQRQAKSPEGGPIACQEPLNRNSNGAIILSRSGKDDDEPLWCVRRGLGSGLVVDQ